MVSLKQVIFALRSLGIDETHINNAIAELTVILGELDEIEVKGRQKLDALLGCMMAIDAIIGNKRGGDENG